MQQLQNASEEHAFLCARDVVETVPPLISTIREIAASNQSAGLTLVQIRALGTLRHFPGATLSLLAERLTLTLSATSRLVDVLVERKLIVRTIPAGNRRCVCLVLSAAGMRAMESVLLSTQRQMAKPLAQLTAVELLKVREALALLRKVFVPDAKQSGFPCAAPSPGEAVRRGKATHKSKR